MRYASIIFCGLFFLITTSNAYCNPWFEGKDVVVNIQAINNPEMVSYRFISHKNGDTEISIRAEKVPNGVMLLLAGKYLLVNGMDLPEGAETDVMDYGGLMYQLVVKILGKVLPMGALEVSMKKEISFSEKNESIKVATSSSSGVYSAPWTANGYAAPNNQKIKYDFEFEWQHSSEGKSGMRLSGHWDDSEHLGLSKEYSLKDFKVYRLGPIVTEKSAEFGATIKNKQFSTVGEFRDYIAKSKP